MEFVGWGVKKQRPDGATLLGVILAFDTASGFFKIVYENGETEELDRSGLSSVLNSAESSSGLLENKWRCILGKDNGNGNSVNGDGVSGVLVGNGGCVVPFGINLNERLDLDDDESNGGDVGDNVIRGGVKLPGFDLNRGMGVDLDEEFYSADAEGTLKVENEGIDLNLDASDDANNFSDAGNAPCIDLNLQLSDNELRGMDDLLGHHVANMGASEEAAEEECRESIMSEFGDMKNLVVNKILDEKLVFDGEDSTLVSMDDNNEIAATKFLKVEFESGSTNLESENKDGILPKNADDSCNVDSGLSEHRPRGRRGRKRKELQNGVSLEAPATCLRRSSRRAKIAALSAQNDVHNEVGLDDPVNQVSSPVYSVISDERATETACQDSSNADIVLDKVDFPPLKCLDLDESLVFDVFYVYFFLRSFSCLLFLSPFELKFFVASIKSNGPTSLFDSIHVSLLKTLKRHLQTLSNEGSASASNCLRSLNWDFLDLITWPVFLLQYILLHCTWYSPGCYLSQFRIFGNDYYQLPVSAKVVILRHICDDISEGEAFRSDVNRRELEMEQLTDSERSFSSRKRKAAINITEENVVEATDLNADECHLCKMDGNLICCDGCPSAFHPRCVGVVSSLLPEGQWYCPECVIEKDSNEWLAEKGNHSIKAGNLIRAEVLGRDPYGRLYHSSCGYLLVLEPLSDDCFSIQYTIRLYNRGDFRELFEVMDSSPLIYDKIKSVICERWNVSGVGETSESSNINPSPLVPPDNIMGKSISHGHGGENYVNYYESARTASSYFGELSSLLSDKAKSDAPLFAEEIIARQLKIVANRCANFSWSNINFSNSKSRKERCGWCFYCRDSENGRDCLFLLKNTFPVLENSGVDALEIQAKNSRSHLFYVVFYILYLEDHLHGLLLGPWLNPHYSVIWRQTLIKAADIAPLKNLLLKLESNLHHLALSADWNKHIDSRATMGSACHIVSSRFCNGRRRAQFSDAGVGQPTSNAAAGLSLFWWRGGRGSRMLFNWKVLPRTLASKAARQGGWKKIAGILYPENGDYAKRTECISWRAAVGTSTTVDQLALQIRELDANIRWDDMSNTTCSIKADTDSKRSVKSFKKVVIRRKLSEGAVSKYLLDFGKRRTLPDVVLKFGCLVEDSKSLRKKYWLEESHVPLHLIKGFEERRISRKTIKSTLNALSGAKKPRDRKGFEYLFARLEASECASCGHCLKNINIGEGVICEQCKGTFHKRHVRKSAEAFADDSKYTCHRCEVPITKNEKGKSKKSQVKNFPRGLKPIISRKTRIKRKGKRVIIYTSRKKAVVMPLRRSVRFAARMAKLSIGAAKGKTRKRRKRVNSENVISKVPSRSCTKKRTTACYSSYWLNGLRLSNRPNDGKFSHLTEKILLVASQQVSCIADKPTCSLCGELEYNPSLNYVACALCGVWFHGDALGLTAEKLEKVIGFKCHSCLHKIPPACPHLC